MAGMGGKGGRSFGDGMFGGFGGESVFRSFSDASGGGPSGPRKAPPVENKLYCTLEEIYNGSTRKMKISRNVVDASGYVFPGQLL
jgi:DnaJ family protein B protein 4